MKLSLPVLVLLFLFHFKLYSQPVYFETSWGGAGNDFARSVRQLSNGDIFVFGYSNSVTGGNFDFALTKLDRFGNFKWTQYYGDSLDDNGLYMNTTADGNLIVVGESYRTASDLDIRMYKIDTSGTVLWSKSYGITTANESVRSVIQTLDGGYALCGFKSDALGFNDCYVIRTNSVGDTLWTKTVGGVDNDYASGICETPGGKLIVSADTKSFGAGGYDVELFLLDPANGNVLWNFPYGDSLQNGSQGVAVSPDGFLYCWGETEISQFSPFDFSLLKTDTLGSVLWRKTLGGLNADAAFSACELPDRSLVLAGYSNSYNTGPINLVVLKTDSSGNLKWVQNYGGAGIDIGYEIIPSVYGGLLICGNTFAGTDDFYLLHLDTSGSISGIQDMSNAGNIFSVYPNPSSGIVSIGWLGAYTKEELSYVIRSPLGEVVSSGMIENDLLPFHKMTPSGIYFVELKRGNYSEMKRVIIAR